jgi:hypothetical protein
MKRVPVYLVSLLLFFVGRLSAQREGWHFSVAALGGYTTTSKVFYNPDSPSSDIRSQYTSVDNIYGGGLELRVGRSDYSFFLALKVEYLSKLQDQIQPVAYAGPPIPAPVKDGFRLIPVELGVNMYIPLGTELARLSMGGGIGAYYGKRILSVAGVDAPQVNDPVGIGIHVESSFDYRVLRGVAVRGEMRFRDPEVTTENQFQEKSAVYNGKTIPFPTSPFRTRINVNGLMFGLGIVVDLF